MSTMALINSMVTAVFILEEQEEAIILAMAMATMAKPGKVLKNLDHVPSMLRVKQMLYLGQLLDQSSVYAFASVLSGVFTQRDAHAVMEIVETIVILLRILSMLKKLLLLFTMTTIQRLFIHCKTNNQECKVSLLCTNNLALCNSSQV